MNNLLANIKPYFPELKKILQNLLSTYVIIDPLRANELSNFCAEVTFYEVIINYTFFTHSRCDIHELYCAIFSSLHRVYIHQTKGNLYVHKLYVILYD